MKRHIIADFDADLRSLKDQIMAMGSLVDAQVTEAIRALTERDVERATRVIEADRAVNQLELAIDEHCIRTLALRQPAASDLRFIAAALKMVTDLERVGDLVVNMAERIAELVKEPHLPSAVDLPPLASAVQKMLRDALEAFVAGDPRRAEEVMAADPAIDAWAARICVAVQADMGRDPGAVASGLATIFFAKHLERIGDHATNVAEMVVYLVSGQDVRHAGSS